jgi:hypothetical protein
MSPKREMVAKPWSFSWVAAKAEMMPENDNPVRIATGTAAMARGECTVPKAAMTPR